MDNIKKFEDFLDRMHGLLDNAKKQGHIIVRVEDLENTFPELKESEDERIRKKLIEYFNVYPKDYYGELKKSHIIAWLEKQGERSDTNSNTENDYTKVYEWLKKNKDRYVHNLGTCGEYIPYCSDKMITDLKNYVESN